MIEWNEAASTADAFEDPIGDAVERGINHLKVIAADLVAASRSAAQSVLDEQKEQAARQVAAVAAAVRAAAQSLSPANLPTLAHYADRAAGNIESFSRALSRRRWGELADDLEILARRRPALFMTAAALGGFLMVRGARASGKRAAAARGRRVSEATAGERESEAIVAAVASAPGGEDRGAPAAGLSGTQEALP
jgi:hypothetical protein